MVNLFYYSIIVAMAHFIYESILLPSWRLQLRYKLFILRDKLASLRHERNSKNENEFEYVEYSINTTINHLSVMSISMLIGTKRELENDLDLKNKVDERIRFIENIKDDNLKEIYNETIRLGSWGVIANSFMVLLYCTPIIIVFKVLRSLGVKVFRLSRQVQQATSMPERQFNSIAHQYAGTF